jgi:biopolymer transport protein ExbD
MAGDVGGGGRKGGGIVAVNIIPLVDIMLVLLIIFMVTATVQSSKNVPVQMPKAASGVGGPSTAIQLSLDRAGVLSLDGKVVDAENAQRMLRETLRGDSTIQVLISADEALNYARVVEVLDLIRAAGVGRYALKVRAVSAGG